MKKIIYVLLFFLLWLGQAVVSRAKVNEDGISAQTDLSEVQSSIDDTLGKEGFSIENFVEDAVSGKGNLNPENLGVHIKELVAKQWELEKKQTLQLIFLGVMAGVFSNFSATLGKGELGETGFYVVYLLLFSVMSVSFFRVFSVAKEAMEGLLSFMKVLVPAFSLSLSAVTGSSTSMAFYEMNIIGMTVVDVVLVQILLPGIQVYFLLNVANHFMKEARFSKLAELIYSGILWSIKTIFGALLGFQGIQMLLYPAIDQLKRGTIWKMASGLPGLGNMFGNITETLFGTGMVIKSAIGVGGLIAIFLICLLPMVKLVLFVVIYKVSGALLQPISDKRIVSSVQVATDSGKLLLSLVACSCVLFLLSIAIVLRATNGVL